VTALVVVWNILARASTVSWILHAGASPRGKDSFDRIQLRTRYVEDVSAYCDAHPFILSLQGWSPYPDSRMEATPAFWATFSLQLVTKLHHCKLMDSMICAPQYVSSLLKGVKKIGVP
jgi:hypothetical protein